jgi:hypothetical protein
MVRGQLPSRGRTSEDTPLSGCAALSGGASFRTMKGRVQHKASQHPDHIRNAPGLALLEGSLCVC